MPYSVIDLDDFFRDAPGEEGAPTAPILEDHLNAMEREGWRLLSVVPDIKRWDDDAQPNGVTGAMIVLHREPVVSF